MSDSQSFQKKYAIVGFSDGSVEVVPTIWIVNEDEVKWPNCRSLVLLSKYIAQCEPACDDWGTQKVKMYSFTNSFKKAKCKAAKLIETSAISSDSPDEVTDVQRKRKKPSRFESSEESAGEESQSLIAAKKYPLPKLPGSIKEPLKESSHLFSRITDVYSKHKENVQPALCSQVLSQRDVASKQKDATQSALFQRMFKYMEGLNSQMKELNEKVDRIERKMELYSVGSVENSTLDFLPSGIKLPIATIEELKECNEKLKAEKEVSALMIRYLHGVGNGKTACSFVLSLTKKMLTSELAMQFSRYGRKGKKSFSDFSETMTVILAATSMKFKDMDREKLSDMFGKALAGSAEWNGRRIRPSDNSLFE